MEFVCAAVFKKLRDLGGLCLGELSAAPTELTFGTTMMFVSYNDHERQVLLVTATSCHYETLLQLTVSREEWTNSGMIRKLNLTGNLILQVPEVEVI